MYAAKKFDFHELSQICTDLLLPAVNIETLLSYLTLATEFDCDALKAKCLEVFGKNTSLVLESEELVDITHEALYLLMSCKEVTGCTEADLFRACHQWARAECRRRGILVATAADIRNVLGEVLHLIRFQDFALNDLKFVKHVLEAADEIALIRHIQTPAELRAEEDCRPEISIECKMSCRSITGTAKPASPHNLPRMRCKKCHKVIDTDVGCEWVCCGECLTVNLCVPCTIDGCHHEHVDKLQVYFNRGKQGPCCSLCGIAVKKVRVSCDLCDGFFMCGSCSQAGLHKHHHASLNTMFCKHHKGKCKN